MTDQQPSLEQRLTLFAQAVGEDYKALRADLQTLLSQQQANTNVTALIEQAITALKNELMGGELDAQLDTLKELGDKLKALETDSSVTGAILTKFTEITAKLTVLEAQITALSTPNLVEIYTTAKHQQGE